MRLPACLAALALAAACTTGTTPAATPTTGAAVPPAATSPTTGAGLLVQANAFRADQGLAPLRADAALDAAALAHARDMATNGFFSHAGSDGSTVGNRARMPGCTWTGLSENIAKGQTTPEAAMSAWIASPGHRRNLLGPYERMGQARAGDLWVAVFGTTCRALRTVDAASPLG
jgi:uncharacterized protein YkwD